MRLKFDCRDRREQTAMSRIRCWGLSLTALVMTVAGVEARPLGNFTVSHYAGFTASGEGLRLRYVLDHAEIPAFQERQAMDRDRDGRVSAAEEADYLKARCAALRRGLSLELDGRATAPTPGGQRMVWAPGAGGLRTLRIELEELVPAIRLGRRWHSVRYRDDNLPARAGWKEIVVCPTPEAFIAESSAPALDRSHALSAYPADQLSSPPQELGARFRFALASGRTGGAGARWGAGAGTAVQAPAPSSIGRDDLLTRLIHRRSFPIAFLPLALLI